jgi:hypothetical protein
MHELPTEARYFRQGPSNYFQLNLAVLPTQMYRLRLRVRSERPFECHF